jgi:hypothetical protein
LQRPILVFGSAPLQICIQHDFLSADVDISVYEQEEAIKELVEEIGFSKGKAPFYIEIVPIYIFRPGTDWRDRAMPVQLDGVGFLFPAPIDILLGKLRRLEEKDVLAFDLVIRRTGHPTEDELIHELRAAWDMFYFQKDGQKSALWRNTEKLWLRVYRRAIDARVEIVQPVLDQLAVTGSEPGYLEELRARLGL